MHVSAPALLALALLLLLRPQDEARPPVRSTPPPSPAAAGLESWPAAARTAQLAYEDEVLKRIEAAEIARWHDVVASEPHAAGTPGDRRVVDALEAAFREMGLEVERHAFHAWLARPVVGELALVAPVEMALSVQEEPLAEDPDTAHPALGFGWNAYSGSGDVTGEVVYANRGTKEDFERLAQMGVSCAGKVVIARYGGNYRGYKAKFAEAAGAIGLVIYTDPADSGYAKGLMYPEGGYANPTAIQRGSIKTLSWYGDPLTPDRPATEDAERLDPESVALPRIPVQPVGWAAAQEILGRMKGESVPVAWQGGLPFRYRLTGGPELRVRVHVEQERELVLSWNVVGTLRGRVEPERLVLLGCHHDAWAFGAADPCAGLISLLEAARALSAAAQKGDFRPRRSIAFAAWGAEEHGIVGSVEWVEAHLERLRRDAVAYFNLDMASMGLDFNSSAAPVLQRVIAGAAGRVRQARGAEGETVLAAWRARGASATDPALPAFGDLGGGSDHVGFIALAGVPSASTGGSGASGVSYHSNYDTRAWYRKVVGEDYESARMVAEVTALAALRLANAPVVPIDAARNGPETVRHLRELTRIGRRRGLFDAEEERPVAVELARIEAAALRFASHARKVQARLAEALAAGTLDDEKRARVDALLVGLDRAWLHAEGMPGRPWYRNLYAATDEDSGYAAWMLPALRKAVEEADAELLARVEPLYVAVFERMEASIDEAAAELP